MISSDPMPSEAAQETTSWSAILDVQDPSGLRTKHPFRRPRVSVGRKREENDLALQDEAVSSQHCEFLEDQGWFVVRDLGSANGTWVNEKRIGEARLRNGDEVRIGSTRITVALEGKVRGVQPRKTALWPPWSGPRSKRLWAGGAGVALAALLGGAWLQHSAASEAQLRAHYLVALRDQMADPCDAAAAQVQALAEVDAQIGGRSLALSLSRGEIKLSKADEKQDVELQELYRKKLELSQGAFSALLLNQQERREAMEKLSRQGQRFAAHKDRKLSYWVESLLNERLRAADELVLAYKQAVDDTRKLVALVEGVVIEKQAPLASALAHFKFRSDPAAALKACHDKSTHAAGGLSGALNALEE